MVLLKKLDRINCPGQHLKYEITKYNPLDWLVNKDSSAHKIFEVDGYIIDKFNKTSGNFTRIEVASEDIRIFENSELFKEIISKYKDKIFLNNIFADLLEVDHWVLVTLNNYPMNYSLKEKGVMSLKYKNINTDLELVSKKFLNIKEVEEGIKTLRKKSFNNVKKLKSAPSYLSCYLNNNTSNPFPGDCDGILFNTSNKKVTAIIEFKTHNIDSPIKNEYIGKYGNQDWRRFKVLYALQKNIELKQGLKPKLYYVAWGTKNIENHKYIKIDQIDNNKILNSELIKKPIFGKFDEKIFQTFI